jgi:hypothetical protein
MVCLRGYKYEILLKNITLKECEDFIKGLSEDVYLVPGGYKIEDFILLGTNAPVGFSGNDIIFQFTKPCFGFFVIRLKSEAEEVKRLRENYKKDRSVKKIQ